MLPGSGVETLVGEFVYFGVSVDETGYVQTLDVRISTSRHHYMLISFR